MELVADILLGGGAIGAGFFCYMLARRLRAFGTLENGMGGAIAVLSAQVDDMTRALEQARDAAGASSRSLSELTERAETAARRLELLVSTLHDLPESQSCCASRPRVVRHRTRDRRIEVEVA